MLAVLQVLSQGRYTIQEEVPSKTWALVGSIGDSSHVGEIPLAYRNEAQHSQLTLAVHKKVLEAGLRTQNYDKGMDKFVRKFDPDEEMSAFISVQSGWQTESAWSVYIEQGPRRCLLMDTVDGMQPEEVLWIALTAWVWFNPRAALPCTMPGRLYYPDEASHIFQQYWNHFSGLSSHPQFGNESPICQAEMIKFSEGLSRLDHSTWYPQPMAEAEETQARVAEDAAVSRLRTIPDGPNQWDMHRSSAFTGGPSSGSAMVGTGLVPVSGSMGTCATSGSPPYT
jgi:hypothetical protein